MAEQKPVFKTKAQIMKDYVANQRKRGHSQVKVWVPVTVVPWLHKVAAEMRMLDEVGLNPLTNLPDTILPSKDANPVKKRAKA